MFKVKKIQHVGIASDQLEESTTFWTAMGLNLTHTEDVKSDAVRTYFFPVGETNLELLEALSPESPVAKFLQKRGPGLHHLCFEVEGIHEALDFLKKKGVKLLDETPRKGAHGYWVAFIHPKSAGGILIELSEKI